MAITSQGENLPAERREMDIATIPIKELREYRAELDKRVGEVARDRDYSAMADIAGRAGMVADAIHAREQGRAVNATDRDVMLGTPQKEAMRIKPVAELSKAEIVTEAMELHAQFKNLSERYQQAPASQRAEIREEMQPVVNRERELRSEYGGRQAIEVTQDRVPQPKVEVGYGR